LVVTLTTLIPAAAASADEGGWGHGGPDNNVYVVNHSDGVLKSRASADVAHDEGTTVANRNYAFARASCTDCRTVAVATQIVIATVGANDVRPDNEAVALNENCLRCQTFAFAYQELIWTSADAHLSESARDQLKDIRRQMDDVARSNADFPTMKTQLDDLSHRLAAAVHDGLSTRVDHDEQRQQTDQRD
jgi:putative peptide zinc metalloprotease protein